MLAVAFHQGTRLEGVTRAVKRNHFAIRSHFFNQAFNHHIQMLNRLLCLDNHFIIVEKGDVYRFLQNILFDAV